VNRLLEDERVNPAAQDNQAILNTSFHGHLAVVNRLLEDERVDPAAGDNSAIKAASNMGRLAVVDRLLQDGRVTGTGLHLNCHAGLNTAATAQQLSLAAVQRLSATLTLPFPANSRIGAWQPRIRAYRDQAVAVADDVVDGWRVQGSGGGVSVEVMDDVVWRYCFGMRLHEYRELALE
jgi:hypothetical protein